LLWEDWFGHTRFSIVLNVVKRAMVFAGIVGGMMNVIVLDSVNVVLVEALKAIVLAVIFPLEVRSDNEEVKEEVMMVDKKNIGVLAEVT